MIAPRIETPNQAQKQGSQTLQQAEPDRIRIYVACLAAYNNGHLHGAWIYVGDDDRDILNDVQAMLETSPFPNAEEWAIHDYEGFEGANISEHDSFPRVVELATFIRKCNGFGGQLSSHFHNDIEDAEKALENYAGQYDSLADYAEEITADVATIPKHLEFYIDYEKMARDMEMGGDVFTLETGYKEIHVFWCH